MRNYEITFDFSGVDAPTPTDDDVDTPVNSIMFGLSATAPTGCVLLKNLDEFFPEEVGLSLGGLVGILIAVIFGLAILSVVLWSVCSKKRGNNVGSNEQAAGLL